MDDKRVQGSKREGTAGRSSGGGPGKTGASIGGTANALRQAQPYIDASWQLIGSVGLGALGGWWLDGRLGTRPWLLVAGAAFGLVAGMISFLRVVSRLAANQPKSKFKLRSFDEPLDGDEEDLPRKKRKTPPPGRWDEEGWDLSRGSELFEEPGLVSEGSRDSRDSRDSGDSGRPDDSEVPEDGRPEGEVPEEREPLDVSSEDGPPEERGNPPKGGT